MLMSIYKKLRSTELDMHDIYELFYKRVFRDAYSVTRDIHLAQDILQETFIKAFNELDSLEDKEKMGAWLSTIAKRTAIDYLRKESKVINVDYDELPFENRLLETPRTVEEIVELNLIEEEIINEIVELKKEYREILILRYKYELAQKEISELKNMKVGTVKSRLHRARKSLIEKLKKAKIIEKNTLRNWMVLL